MAFEMGAEAAARYAYMHAKQEAQRGKCGAAAAVLATHGCPAEPANYELYRHVAREIVSSPNASSDAQQALKKMLLQLVTALHAMPSVDALVLQVGDVCLLCLCPSSTTRTSAELDWWLYALSLLSRRSNTRAEGCARTLRSLSWRTGWGMVRAGVQKAARRGALHGTGHADDGQGVARHGGGAEGGAAKVRRV
jgi:hypothetical protein